MVRTTRKQREAIFKVFQRDFPSWITPFKRHRRPVCEHCGLPANEPVIARVSSVQYRRFRRLVQPAFGDTCVMLPWKGMWLGIETDGHTHS